MCNDVRVQNPGAELARAQRQITTLPSTRWWWVKNDRRCWKQRTRFFFGDVKLVLGMLQELEGFVGFHPFCWEGRTTDSVSPWNNSCAWNNVDTVWLPPRWAVAADWGVCTRVMVCMGRERGEAGE